MYPPDRTSFPHGRSTPLLFFLSFPIGCVCLDLVINVHDTSPFQVVLKPELKLIHVKNKMHPNVIDSNKIKYLPILHEFFVPNNVTISIITDEQAVRQIT